MSYKRTPSNLLKNETLPKPVQNLALPILVQVLPIPYKHPKSQPHTFQFKLPPIANQKVAPLIPVQKLALPIPVQNFTRPIPVQNLTPPIPVLTPILLTLDQNITQKDTQENGDQKTVLMNLVQFLMESNLVQSLGQQIPVQSQALPNLMPHLSTLKFADDMLSFLCSDCFSRISNCISCNDFATSNHHYYYFIFHLPY